MTITIKENSASGSTLLASTTIIVDAYLPEIMFLKGSFYETISPRWSTTDAIGQDHDFSDYMGSKSDVIDVNINLYGSNRNTNLEIIRNFRSKILYIDVSDIDSNLSGTYVCMQPVRITRNEKLKTILIKMKWKVYNNG